MCIGRNRVSLFVEGGKGYEFMRNYKICFFPAKIFNTFNKEIILSTFLWMIFIRENVQSFFLETLNHLELTQTSSFNALHRT